jgi:hypothetical protein
MTTATDPYTPPQTLPQALPQTEPEAGELRSVTDLTLGELTWQLVRAPRRTLAALGGALAAPAPSPDEPGDTASRLSDAPTGMVRMGTAPTMRMRSAIRWSLPTFPALPPFPEPPGTPASGVAEDDAAAVAGPRITASAGLTVRTLVIVALLAVIIVLALFATNALVSNRNVNIDETPIPFAGLLLILMAVGFGALVWVDVTFQRHAPYPREARSAERADIGDLILRYGARIGLGAVAVGVTWLAWNANEGARHMEFTSAGANYWLLSIVLWVVVFFDGSFNILRWLGMVAVGALTLARRTLRFRLTWTLIALVAILIVGAYFRFSNLGAFPPDMTSDHVEKVRDAWKIDEGLRPIFLDNNGGREPAYFYFLTILHNLTGVPFTFDLIKIGSGLWGMVTLVLAWWMGRAIIGSEDRALGNLTGVLMSAMVAVSYWHTMLSRLGLRIVTTTVVAMLVMVFLVRAVRHNRRADWIITGVVLGVGMYFYQAVRMLPVVIIAGVVLGLLFQVRSWRAFFKYAFNGLAMVIIALAIFVPLGRYMVEYPDYFWSRSTGRLFGEDVIEIRDDKGALIETRLANNQDRLEALRNNLGFLGSNMIKSAWMFNWQGDRAWITGSPAGEPELDPFVGMFFVLGVGLMVVRAIRRRDPTDLLFPIAALIMLLPTALSLAFVIEVPSATRASGALPMVYFMAALALALALRMITEKLRGLAVRQAVYGLAVIGILFGASWNFDAYFRVAMRYYRDSTLPYSQAGDILRGFSESVGSSGNAFMISYPHWWDHRALAIEAGDVRWDNGILETDMTQRLVNHIKGNVRTPYEMRPDRQLMFFLHRNADESLAELQTLLPGGVVTTVDAYNETRNFKLYVVEPVGCEWVRKHIGDDTSFCPPV